MNKWLFKGVLLGNPVDKSISHLTHGEILKAHGIDGSYFKRKVELSSLEEALKAVRAEGYRWAAVTMPFKEDIIPFMDEIDSHALAIGAVNTIDIQGGKLIGRNTDGAGCLNAIESKGSVKGKTVLILGAGGAARAIAYEAKLRGAFVQIHNRTFSKARKLAEALAVVAVDRIADYDILINTTPVGMLPDRDALPIDPNYLIPSTLVMDIIYAPLRTKLLEEAHNRGCETLSGLEMFIELTYLQFHMVFGQKIEKAIVSNIVKKAVV